MVTEKEKKNLVDYWSAEYKKVDTKPRYCNLALIKLFERYLPDLKGKKVLDVGCGHDILMPYFKKRGAIISGVDICPEVVSLLEKEGFEAILSDCCDMPIRDSSYDITFSIGVFEHFDGTEKAVREQIRVTRRGGKVIIILPNLISPFFFGAALVQLVNGNLFRYGKKITDGRYFTSNQLRKMMKGCKNIKIIKFSTSSFLKLCTNKYNKNLAEFVESSSLNRNFGFLLFAIGTKS